MKCLSANYWSDYQLIDSGLYMKLERFGQFVLSRPEPQAVWDKGLNAAEWDKLSHAEFRKEKNNPEKGEWVLKKGMKEQWNINYKYKEMDLNFRLGLSSFKHVGLFPEQAENWNFIYDRVKSCEIANPKVLNLFAYTGGASVAARAAGAEVTHLDSVKPVVTWARENMEASKLDNIRWIVEDAMKFVQREERRGNKYHGIILDPPAYGRGADGEKWILEEQINSMLHVCKKILHDKDSFLVLNLYSMGFSALIVETLLHSIFGDIQNLEVGELYAEDKFKKKLPLGVFGRFSS